MEPVKIRLSMLSEVLAKLINTTVGTDSKFRKYVQVKSAQFSSLTSFEVDLNIRREYGEIEPSGGKCVTVTREMVGELFDLLGLFPRSERVVSKAEVEEAIRLLEKIQVGIYGVESALKNVELPSDSRDWFDKSLGVITESYDRLCQLLLKIK